MSPDPADSDPRGASLENSALLARLPGVTLLHLSVERVDVLTPALRRVRLGAPELATFDFAPGQDLMFSIPEAGLGTHVRRRYTIRRLDRSVQALDVDVVVHDDGPGARWAAGAAAGDMVEAIGPRGKITLDPAADWHLFMCDESGLPGAQAMVEALAPGGRAVVVAEVGGTDGELAVEPPAGTDVTVTWVHRGGREPGDAEGLADALGSTELRSGTGHAYLSAELTVVATLRRSLIERGLDAARISAKAYWRRGVANAAHGEPTAD